MNKNSPSYTLMTPGPVPLPNEVLQILAKPMEHHRTPEFMTVFKRTLENLKKVFMTEQPVFIHTSTGSGAMESALVNCLSPGDHVIAVVSGKFGERWAEMAEVFGARVTRIEVPWGQAVDVAKVEEALSKNPDAVAVISQACETSTGVLQPVRELAQLTKNHSAVLIIDGITALGALPMPMDQWGIDVLIAGSQKAFMLPTGLSFISLSKKAWKLAENAKCPRYYFDLRREKKSNENGESYFSTSVTPIRALDLVLEIFLKHGLHKVQERIQTLSHATLLATREFGLEAFAKVPSPSLSAIRLPAEIDGQKLRSIMEEKHHVVVMGGQDQLKGKIIRIGHMGAITDADLLKTLEALASSLNELKPGSISIDKINSGLNIAKAKLHESPAVLVGTESV